MHYQVINTADVVDEVLPMDEVMEYLRVYDALEEPLLNLYREAAIDYAQTYTNRIFGSATVLTTFPFYKESMYLPLGSVMTVSNIDARLGDEIITVTDYRFNPVSSVLDLSPKYKNHTDFFVTFDTHYKVPAAMKIGMLKLIATWYENREDVSNGVSVALVPMNHRHCFDLYRLAPTGV